MFRLTEFGLQLLGLWPYYYDRHRSQFVHSTVLDVYGALINICAVVLLACSVYSFNGSAAHQAGFNVYSYQMHAYLQMFAIVTIFGSQRRYGSRLVALADDWIRVINDMRQQYAHVSVLGFRSALLLFTIKFIGVNAVKLTAVFNHVVATEPTIGSSSLAVAAWLLPSMMLTTLPDTFFGLLLMQNHFYRLLNGRMREVVATLQRRVIATNADGDGEGGKRRSGDTWFAASKQRPFERMQICCDLSERLDELALLHGRVTVSVQRLNRAVAWPLLMWSLSGMFMLVLRLYVQFMEVARMVDAKDVLEFRPVEFGLKLLSLAATFCGMVLLADACLRMVHEVWRLVLFC